MTTLVVRHTKVPTWVAWVGLVVLCNGVGFLSSLAARGEMSLYERLVQPSWSPPSWLFAPVWTALYTLMATATYLVWRDGEGATRRRALGIFAVQLVLNAAWSPVFFGLGKVGAGLVIIVAYLASVIAMMIAYARSVRLAGALIVPLALWTGFATALNASIWWLNR
jgi:tryptophan-rich sensory protein